MYPDRGIVCMDRHSDGLSVRPDNANNLILKSTGTNNAPRDPLLGLATRYNDPTSTFGIQLHLNLWNHHTY